MKRDFQELLEKVLEGTKRKKLQWRDSADEDGFSTSLGVGSLFLSRELNPTANEAAHVWQYTVELFNTYGQAVEEMKLIESGADYSLVEQVYEEARRSARTTDDTIRAISNRLDELLKEK